MIRAWSISTNKTLELDCTRWPSIWFDVGLIVFLKGDHAPHVAFTARIAGYGFELSWYDNRHEEDAQCKQGLHSWIDEVGKLPADTRCTRCGEPYGDVK